MIYAFLGRKRRHCQVQDCELSEWCLEAQTHFILICRSQWRACTKTCMGGMTEQELRDFAKPLEGPLKSFCQARSPRGQARLSRGEAVPVISSTFRGRVKQFHDSSQ